MEKSLKCYNSLQGNLDPGESLNWAVERLTAIRGGVDRLPSMKGQSWKKAERGAEGLFLWIAMEKKKGTFGERSATEATSLLVEELLLHDSIEDALIGMLFKLGEKSRNQLIFDNGDIISIGGIKLEVRDEQDQ